MENTWKKALSAEPPEEVKVKILPVYKGNSKRPERFIIEYNIGDDIFKKKNLKNAPGGK